MSQKINSSVLFGKIVEELKKHPYGISSIDLSRIMEINRMTLVKYLTQMQDRGLIEFKQIGMAKVWHTSTKLDLASMVAREESQNLLKLINGEDVKVRKQLDDVVHLAVFRSMKVALSLSMNPNKAMYNAGKFLGNSSLPQLTSNSAQEILKSIAHVYSSLGLGILKPVLVTPTHWSIIIEGSATAYGTALRGNKLCYFEAGLLSGYIGKHVKRETIVKESKCIGTGSPYCEFDVTFQKKGAV